MTDQDQNSKKDKLSSWLANNNFLNKKKSPQDKSSSATDSLKKTAPNTQNSRTHQAPGTKVQTSTPQKNTRPQDQKTRPQNTSSRNTSNRNSTASKSFGGRGRNAPQQFTKNNPLFDRPTIEKKEKFHPTNYLPKIKAGEIRVVPLGGMEQVGENMMFLEWEDDIVIIDTGFLFPSPEHLGVDVLIPNIDYLIANKHKIRAIIYTHGHLDHIGGIPFLVPDLGYPPMYATRLTKELIFAQCSEHEGLSKKIKVNDITPKSKLKLGKFEFEFFHINHSIPDGVGVVAKTPYGAIIHSSDFKFDYNPSDDQPIDLNRLAQIGNQGVALAMVDSTSASKPGMTPSESDIEKTLEKIIQGASGRIVLATFASNIGRIGKLVEAAERNGRTVFLSGRSMERNIAIARKLNYLKCKDATLQPMGPKANRLNPSKVLILSTGSQGEELAALTRMSAGTHRDIKLTKEDTVVFSSSPIPGNEMAIVSVLNNLSVIECTVINHRELNTHVSGHAHAEDCKLMVSLFNPKYFAPIHGEVFMRHAHRDMMVDCLQIKKENTFIMNNGQGIVLSPTGARLMTEKEAEATAGPEKLVQLGEILHDDTIESRTMMSKNGIIIINIQSKMGKIENIEVRVKGFLYMNQDNEIFKILKKDIQDIWSKAYTPAQPEKLLEKPITNHIQRFFLKKFRQEQFVEVFIN